MATKTKWVVDAYTVKSDLSFECACYERENRKDKVYTYINVPYQEFKASIVGENGKVEVYYPNHDEPFYYPFQAWWHGLSVTKQWSLLTEFINNKNQQTK